MLIELKNHLLGYHNANKLYKIPVAVFDIDGTLLDDSQGPKEYYDPNNEVCKIAEACLQHGVKIIVLTARPMESKIASHVNLQMHGIKYHKLITNDHNEPPSFKRRVRKELDDKYHVLLAIGDKTHDYDSSPEHCLRIKVEKGKPYIVIV